MLSSQWRRYVAWALGALAVAFALVALARYTSQGEEAADLLPSAVVSSADGLTARVTLGTSTLPVGTPVSFWLSVANEGNQTRSGITLQKLHLDGMKAVGSCWEKVDETPYAPVCLADAPTATVRRWPLELEAKTQVTFWASVEASESGTAKFAVTVQAPLDAASSAPVILRLIGPEVRASRGWLTPNHIEAFLALLGDLGDLVLPIVLAALGYHFSRTLEKERRAHENAVAEERDEYHRRQDEAKRVREEAIAEERKQYEKRQDEERRVHEKAIAEENQRHEVWRQMVPRVHENAQKYYMPVSGAIGALRSCYDELVQLCQRSDSTELPDDVRRSDHKKDLNLRKRLFYHLMMVFLRMQALRREIGGFYFQSEEGEVLASSLWHIFRDRCRRVDVDLYVDFQLVVDHLVVGESIATFDARLMAPTEAPTLLSHEPRVALNDQPAEIHKALVKVRDRWFDSWLKNELARQNDLYLLRLLEGVLDYEMNVPYRLWYGKSTKTNEIRKERIQKLKVWREWLQALEKGSDLTVLYDSVKRYFGKDFLITEKHRA